MAQLYAKDRRFWCMHTHTHTQVDVDNRAQRAALEEMAQLYSKDRRVPLLPRMMINTEQVPDTALRLKEVSMSMYVCMYILSLYSYDYQLWQVCMYVCICVYACTYYDQF